MRPALGPAGPEQFFIDLFGSRAARRGEVVRRKVRDVEKYVGREEFIAELQRRGYPSVENAGQFVIFCNRAPIRRIT
ncbi:MAG: N-(5'-phosphoribosyl)anthranilate isomerase [Pseudomonadota bacterium]